MGVKCSSLKKSSLRKPPIKNEKTDNRSHTYFSQKNFGSKDSQAEISNSDFFEEPKINHNSPTPQNFDLIAHKPRTTKKKKSSVKY